jgi:hypothetical protein
MFCRYSTWYISLLLSAGYVSKKKRGNCFPVTLSLTLAAHIGVDFFITTP